MAEQDQNKRFDWNAGEVISDKDVTPLGGVRKTGLSKVTQSPLADPKARHEEREKYLESKQTQTYKATSSEELAKPDPVLVEDTGSGVGQPTETEQSEIDKLIGTGNNKFRGLDRFGKKDS